VFANERPVKINSMQKVEEFAGEGNPPSIGYLLHVNMDQMPEKPYVVFRILADNLDFNEKGENIYFYEVKDYN
ncbi:MAG TPA: carboxypeptidase regulatory-like domain-containing protein, partial [Prolixibacteraceae bacterium]|nr:carboxypeptidase regulatory-like domain-containing protein [Prolixibacteraceae bacterium]